MSTSADSASQAPPLRRRRIGVLLPAACGGELLDAAINQALMLKMGSETAGEAADVVVSNATGQSDAAGKLCRLAENGIVVRETTWQPISKEELGIAGRYMGVEFQLDAPACVYPSDGARNFLDCDFWYVIADTNAPPLAPLRPYAVFVNDCLQRYLPEMFDGLRDAGFIATVRGSAIALCTTPFTRDDLVQYVGLPARKVALLPFGLGSTLFDATDEYATANALKDADRRLVELKQRLQGPADLAKFHLGSAAPLLWNVVRQYV